jgi:hypothetical protein
MNRLVLIKFTKILNWNSKEVSSMNDQVECINLHSKIGAIGFIAMLLFTFLFASVLLFPPFPISYQYTYELLFGPSTLIGYFSLFYVIIKTRKLCGAKQALKIFGFTLVIWIVANYVDFWLIYFEAWTFNPLRHSIEMFLPLLPKKTFFNNQIHIPAMEVYGFNMIITWVILFLSSTIASFMNEITIIIRPKNPNEKTISFHSS